MSPEEGHRHGMAPHCGERMYRADPFAIEQHLDNKTPDGMRHIMHKSGFSKDEMCGYMREAGLVDVRFDVLPETVHMEIHGRGSERQVFFASGKRAA